MSSTEQKITYVCGSCGYTADPECPICSPHVTPEQPLKVEAVADVRGIDVNTGAPLIVAHFDGRKGYLVSDKEPLYSQATITTLLARATEAEKRVAELKEAIDREREACAEAVHNLPDANDDPRGSLYAMGWTSGIRASEAVIRARTLIEDRT